MLGVYPNPDILTPQALSIGVYLLTRYPDILRSWYWGLSSKPDTPNSGCWGVSSDSDSSLKLSSQVWLTVLQVSSSLAPHPHKPPASCYISPSQCFHGPGEVPIISGTPQQPLMVNAKRATLGILVSQRLSETLVTSRRCCCHH